MTLNEYAWKILRDHGCDEYTYGGEWSKHVFKDLKEAYPNGMEFPYVEVANEILSFSRAQPIVRAPFRMVYDMPDCIDGIDCESLEEGMERAKDTLIEWACQEKMKWLDWEHPTSDEIDDWNYMIYNFGVWVDKYNPETDEYEEYAYLSDDDYNLCGWKEIPEQEE